LSYGIKNAGEITCCSFVEEMEFSPAGIIKGVRKCPIRKRQVMGVFQAKDLHEHPDIKRIHGVFAAADLFPMEIPCVFLEYRVKNGMSWARSRAFRMSLSVYCGVAGIFMEIPGYVYEKRHGSGDNSIIYQHVSN